MLSLRPIYMRFRRRVALAEEYDVPLVYDAHEFWPYSIPELRHWEVEFWAEVERTLA